MRRIARTNADGSRVAYLQLARKVRDGESGVPRDEVLCHLGREDELDRGQIERLIESFARILDPARRGVVAAGQGGEDRVVERTLASAAAWWSVARAPSSISASRVASSASPARTSRHSQSALQPRRSSRRT